MRLIKSTYKWSRENLPVTSQDAYKLIELGLMAGLHHIRKIHITGEDITSLNLTFKFEYKRDH